MHARLPEPQPSEQREPSEQRRARSRRFLPRWWVWRVLMIAALVLLVVVAATQIVLWTNVPRNLVLKQLEKQLGLRVEAASLSTGWLGSTKLRDVTIALPLSDKSLLRVPAMRVKHNSLFGLLWTRAVALDAIELHEPHLIIRQDAAGQWNLQQVADLLARTGGKEAAAVQAKKKSRPELPALEIVNGTIEVIDRNGRTTTIQPVNVEGEPENTLTWKYKANAGHTSTSGAAPHAQLVGRLVPGGTWEHEVDVAAQHVQRWAEPWTGDSAPDVSLASQWYGQVRGGVVGRLVIAALNVANVHTTGSLSLQTEAGVVALRPENLIVHTAQKAVPELRITAGKLALDGKSATAHALTVLTFNGAARVDGRYDWASGSADLKAKWSDFAVPGQTITHDGSLTASLRHPFPGQPVVSARLTSSGKMPSAGWEADLIVGGSGSSWRNVDWTFTAKSLSLTGAYPVLLDGLAATVQTRGDLVSLTSLHGPGAVVARGRGQFDLATRAWDVRLDLSNLPRPVTIGRQGPLAITLNAHGTSEYIRLENPGLSLRGNEAEIRIDGSYVYNIPKPVDVTVYVNHIPPRVVSTDQPPVFGYLRGQAHVTGTALYPTDLVIAGNLVGRDVRFLDRPIGEIQAGISGRIDDERLTLRTEQLQLLGGQWQLNALFPEKGVLGMHLSIDNLPLKEIGLAFKRPDFEGIIDARFAFLIPQLEPEAVKVTAEIKGRDIKAAKVAADQLEATVVLADGLLSVDPIRLRKGDGQANLAAELDVREFRRISASIALAAWPFEPTPGTKAELWGGTTGLRVILPGAIRKEGIRLGIFHPETKITELRIFGPIDLAASFTVEDQPAGDAHVIASLRGRVLDLRSLSYDGLDGTVQGHAVIDFDRILEMRGGVFWEDFNAERIPEFFPENETLVGLAGRFSGEARIAPAQGSRPLEPLRIKGNITPSGLRYRSVPIGPIQFSAFTNLDRLVIQDSPENPTTVVLAGGLARVWGRFTRLEPGEELSRKTGERALLLSHFQVSFERLDLDQLVHAFKPDAEPMVGKLTGSFEALAGTRSHRRPGALPTGQGLVEKVIRRVTADGRIELTESDLINLDVVAALYGALNVAPDPQQPVGKGELTFHLEDGLLSLNNIRYFNRGTELRGIMDIDEVWRIPDSPLTGTAVGTARPFRDMRLPFFSTYDLDKIFTMLQTDLTTVGLDGTVRNPTVNQLAFSDLGEGMRMFILGDFQQANRKERRR